MSITVNVNGLSLCHKGSEGVSTATLPDVCKTPPTPTPVPYPNVSYSKDLSKGTTTVSADGGNMIANYGSEFATSTGDEPGTEGGVKSGVYTKESTWITFSFDVKFEGKAACRLTDKMFHNRHNTVNAAGETQPQLTPENLKAKVLACEESKAVYERAKAANGGRRPTIVVERTQLQSGGATILDDGMIKIDPVDENGTAFDFCVQVETLTFELANLSRKADFNRAENAIRSSTRDQYIKAHEEIEYNNAKDTATVTEACKEAWGCPNLRSEFEWVKQARDFDDFFARFLDDSHKEHYGNYWDTANSRRP